MQYRFDDVGKKVWRKPLQYSAFHLAGTYAAFGIEASMTDAEKIELVDWDDNVDYSDSRVRQAMGENRGDLPS